MRIALLVFTCFVFTSCGLTDYGLGDILYRKYPTSDRTQSILEASTSSFIEDRDRILILTDVHFGGENGKKTGERRDDDAIDAIEKDHNDSPFRFCLCLGDIAEHGYKEEFEAFNDKIVTPLETLRIHTYSAIGNHDLYNDGYDYYKDLIEPKSTFYHFETLGYSWYCLDSASNTLGDRQYRMLKNLFKNDSKDKIIITHIPLYAEDFFYFIMQNTCERNLLINLFANNSVKAVLDGHTHKKNVTDFGKFVEYNFPGYLEKYSYGILTIKDGKIEVECKNY